MRGRCSLIHPHHRRMGRPAASLLVVAPATGRNRTSVSVATTLMLRIVKDLRIAHTGSTTAFRWEGLHLLIQRRRLDDDLKLFQYLGPPLLDVADDRFVVE